ncbi:hypothetical protein CKAN_02248300 [Cinnamomum micranthum f. kanehirae]|uniref:Uncharacterized protein n=1 Tax=Cinnamomum micranthum f. kanehirae TaxID=337451 RepID=A0A3S3NE08_9MAGN|nr:hypothetical protein CKAN_02248300 [Cinnamomum micranthum f. kanehirae]
MRLLANLRPPALICPLSATFFVSSHFVALVLSFFSASETLAKEKSLAKREGKGKRRFHVDVDFTINRSTHPKIRGPLSS